MDILSPDSGELLSYPFQSQKTCILGPSHLKRSQPYGLFLGMPPSFTTSALPEPSGFSCPHHSPALDKFSSDRNCIEEQGLWLVPQAALGQGHWPLGGSEIFLGASLSHLEFLGMFPNLPSGPARGEGLARSILPLSGISNSFTNHKWALRLHLVPTASFSSITFPPS